MNIEFSYGTVDRIVPCSRQVFVLDVRGEQNSGGCISAAQRSWMESGMRGAQNSGVKFKARSPRLRAAHRDLRPRLTRICTQVILNPVPITDMSSTSFFGTSYSKHWMSTACSRQRQAILSGIVAGGITGVLWISADLHWVRPTPAAALARSV